MNIQFKPITESIGTIVLGNSSSNIFDLDRLELIELFKETSVILFRGFDVDAEKFKSFTELFSTDFLAYVGGAYSRETINGDKTLLSVTGHKQTFPVPFHGEMYYKKNKPEMMWFYCLTPAVNDGETTFCDGVQVYNELSPLTKERFSTQKIKYIRTYQDGSWQKIYQSESVEEVEKLCQDNDMTLKLNPDGSITTEYICSAIVESRNHKGKAFINNILPVVAQEEQGQTVSIIRFEDGEKIPEDMINEIKEVTERLTHLVPWQSGDVLWLDNRRLLHGRRGFNDTQRDIYVRLCNPSFPLSIP